MDIPVVQFTKSEVPSYLHESAFYNSLGDLDNDIVSVPIECWKVNTTVADLDGLKHLLQTMRFWGLSRFPHDALHFIFENDVEGVTELLNEFEPEPSTAQNLLTIHNQHRNARFEAAACIGRLDALMYFEDAKHKLNENALHSAVKNGHLECAKFIAQTFRERAINMDFDFACRTVAKYGHLECLQYVYAFGGKWDSETCLYASSSGHLECLKYAHEHGCPWHVNTCTRTAEAGHLNCLTYAHQHGALISAHCAPAAAKHGHLECLKYCLYHCGERDHETSTAAAMGGHFHCLQYACDDDCPYDAQVAEAAVQGRSVECLHYLVERGCALHSSVAAAAAVHGDFAMLVYLCEHGCPVDSTVTWSAAYAGCVDCLRYLLDMDCPVDSAAFGTATKHDSVECLQLLDEHARTVVGVAMDGQAVYNGIASYNSMGCLLYMAEHHSDVKYPVSMWKYAALNGNIDILRYIHQRGAPRDISLCRAAAEKGSLERVLKVPSREWMRLGRDYVRRCCILRQSGVPNLRTRARLPVV